MWSWRTIGPGSRTFWAWIGHFRWHGNSFFQTKGKSETSDGESENYKWLSFVDRQKCWATMVMCKLMWDHCLLVEISTQNTIKVEFFFLHLRFSSGNSSLQQNKRPTHRRKHLNICIWYRYCSSILEYLLLTAFPIRIYAFILILYQFKLCSCQFLVSFYSLFPKEMLKSTGYFLLLLGLVYRMIPQLCFCQQAAGRLADEYRTGDLSWSNHVRINRSDTHLLANSKGSLVPLVKVCDSTQLLTLLGTVSLFKYVICEVMCLGG